MKNSNFLKALRLEENSIPPIWFMRQAGRYLPEYQAIRRGYKNFLDMCKEPRICAELALQPIERFNLDASILFSDILTIPDAFDLGLAFHEGEGPKFSNPISSSEHIDNLDLFQIDKLDYVFRAIEESTGIVDKDFAPATIKSFNEIKKFVNSFKKKKKSKKFPIKTLNDFESMRKKLISYINASKNV